ncbi:MAG: methylisocitrate lyase, partial [Armatimonadota bacterium]
GIHLEDQLHPKRCGHLDGKALIEMGEMLAKLRAASEARRDPSFVLIARTDARGVLGLDEAIRRAHAYIEAGADMIFPEGLADESEFRTFRAEVPGVPLLANMTEFGKTPLIPAARFAELGYALVIFPVTMMRAILKTLDAGYAELLSTGTQAGFMDQLRTRKELYERIGYADYNDADARWQ